VNARASLLSVPTTSSALRARAARWWWRLLLCAVLLWQALSLNGNARETVAPYYPRDFDQVQYLTESYTGYELLHAQGLLPLLQQPRAQGMLLQLEASLLFQLTGPSRLTALDLNLCLLLVYIAATAWALRSTLGTPAALASIGLIASATTTLRVGGAFDFRLDFAGMCLWGTLLALLLVVPVWRTRRVLLSVGLCAVASMLVLTRLISLVYVMLLLGGLLALHRKRLLIVPLASALVAAGVFVAANWLLISNYYIVGHVTGAEKSLRALEAGVTDVLSSLTFYLRSLVRDHTGTTFLELSALVIAAGVASVLAERRPVTPGQRRRWPWTASVLVLAVLGPYLALTLDESKSTVVGDVFVPPLVLAVVWALGGRGRTSGRVRHAASLAIGAAVLVIGIRSQWNQLQHSTYELSRSDLAAASALMQDAGDYVRTTRSGAAVWATNARVDFTPPLVTRLYYYEQHGVWLSLRSSLGDGGIETALTPDDVLQEAATSDVLVLMHPGGSPYPYDQSLERMTPDLYALADSEYTLLRQYHVVGQDVSLYVRRTS
jgi:hypothetical protein